MENNNISETKKNGEWYEIPEDEIPSVAEHLIQYWPESLNVYNIIIENMKLSCKTGRTKTQLFCNKQNGLFIVTIKGAYRRAAAFSSDKNYSDIKSALEGDDIIKWSDGPVILSGIPMDLFEYLKNISPSIGKSLFYREDIFDCYWISAEVTKEFNIQCPDDMYFSKLEDIHANIVNSTWTYGTNESIGMISDVIKFMDTVGLFTKKDSKLISWVLNTLYGVGMLFTIEEYRGKGYGTLVLKKLANILGHSGRHPILCGLRENLGAKSVICKSGFTFVESLKYIQIKKDPEYKKL